ncbi:hypothetical protein QBC34DRAFT_109638 [Podospora aff. communis PSN243]|uniref:Uncharacterized protein n=1 Tax=Podospora aff. communis PSN243 TaxID=3040156 RepID=A0AAV9GKP1_9PEZI|nr:hypothetical protein QBC34DRAFT_109638 [Podospora aff. communis PSN243]
MGASNRVAVHGGQSQAHLGIEVWVVPARRAGFCPETSEYQTLTSGLVLREYRRSLTPDSLTWRQHGERRLSRLGHSTLHFSAAHGSGDEDVPRHHARSVPPPSLASRRRVGFGGMEGTRRHSHGAAQEPLDGHWAACCTRWRQIAPDSARFLIFVDAPMHTGESRTCWLSDIQRRLCWSSRHRTRSPAHVSLVLREIHRARDSLLQQSVEHQKVALSPALGGMAVFAHLCPEGMERQVTRRKHITGGVAGLNIGAWDMGNRTAIYLRRINVGNTIAHM